MKHNNYKYTTLLPKSLWRFYAKYATKGKGWTIFLWMLCAFIITLNGVLQPNVQKWVVSLFENPVPSGVNFISYALPTVIFITILNIIITLSHAIEETIFMRWAPQIRNKISEILTGYAHNQSMHFWTGRMAGSITSQIGYIQDGVGAADFLWESICRLIVIFINAGMLFSINKYIAIIFGFSFVFRIVFAWKMRNGIKKASEERASAGSSLSGKLVDSISNYSIVKLFVGKNKEEQILHTPRIRHIDAITKLNYKMRVFWTIPGVLWDILLGATVICCAYLFMYGKMTVAEIVYTISVYFVVMGSISMLINMAPKIIDIIGSAKKAYAELVVPIDIKDKPNASLLKVKRGKIEFQNVSFKYKNKLVLNNLSLTINPGERVGIVGASGAGKTTLVNLLMRFYDVNKGSITIDNKNIQDVYQESLRDNISFIPQDPTMFNRTIRENIAYAKENATLSEIKKAAQNASADKFIMSTELKYDSTVGDRGIKLSGGQKQRIAIARAFLKNAPILILDEATSALDSETETAIQKSFDKLSKGKTTIAIAHRLSTLRNMDRLVVLERGRIVEEGSHQSLLRKKGIYYKIWKLQSGGFLQDRK